MDSPIDFDINESLKQYLSDPASIPTSDADAILLECEHEPDNLTSTLINSALNPIIDAVAENPEALAQPAVFDSLQFFLKCAPTKTRSQQQYILNSNFEQFPLRRSAVFLSTDALGKIFDLLVSGLSTEAGLIHNDLEVEDAEGLERHKQILEMYAFLLQWTIAAVETKSMDKTNSTAAPMIRGKGAKGGKASKGVKDSWDSATQIQSALDVMSKVLKLRLARVFITTSEKDTFISLFTRAVYLVLENEVRVKSTAIRMHSFKVLCIAVKHHGHAYGKMTSQGWNSESLIFIGAQTSIIQSLSYFEHLSEPMAEFLHILAEQYDYPQLAEEIIR